QPSTLLPLLSCPPHSTHFRSPLNSSRSLFRLFFFFNNPAPPEISTLSLHDALPIFFVDRDLGRFTVPTALGDAGATVETHADHRSEEHTSELQSLTNLVCRLLLEKKKDKNTIKPNLHSVMYVP